jgi:RimJ/RimL family protein N-acetyltransferase
MIEIRPSLESDLPALHTEIGWVARERKYLGTVEPGSLEHLVNFWKRLQVWGVGQWIATEDSRIVGWCDVERFSPEGFRHAGRLGMGVVKKSRGKGIGRRLIEKMLSNCRDLRLERVELSVYSSNLPALRLYESVGFVSEGVKVRQRCLDGIYEDVVMMARIFP